MDFASGLCGCHALLMASLLLGTCLWLLRLPAMVVWLVCAFVEVYVCEIKRKVANQVPTDAL